MPPLPHFDIQRNVADMFTELTPGQYERFLAEAEEIQAEAEAQAMLSSSPGDPRPVTGHPRHGIGVAGGWDRPVFLPEWMEPGEEMVFGGMAHWFVSAAELPGQDDYGNAIFRTEWRLSYSDIRMTMFMTYGEEADPRRRHVQGFYIPEPGRWYQEPFPELEDWCFAEFTRIRDEERAREREQERAQESAGGGRRGGSSDDFDLVFSDDIFSDSEDDDMSF